MLLQLTQAVLSSLTASLTPHRVQIVGAVNTYPALHERHVLSSHVKQSRSMWVHEEIRHAEPSEAGKYPEVQAVHRYSDSEEEHYVQLE